MRKSKKQSLIFSVVIFSLASSIGFAQVRSFSNPKCSAQNSLTEIEMNPDGIANFIDKNVSVLPTVEEFICCLPQRWRENYVVAHSSSAAQSSMINNPRVFLFDPGEPKILLSDHRSANVNLILTMNGGNTDLPQSKNVEMLFANRNHAYRISNTANSTKTYGEVELYDLSFKGNFPHLSEPNPEFCLLCHGVDGKKVGVGGAKPIFEPRGQWTRFHRGLEPCNATEAALFREVNRVAKQTFFTNPRFQCLKPKMDLFASLPPSPQVHSAKDPLILRLDQKLAEINSRRVAKEIYFSPDFQRYQFLIAGLGSCIKPEDDLRNWIPEKVFANELIQKNFLYKEFQVSQNLVETMRAFYKLQKLAGLRIEESQRAAIRELKAGRVPVLDFNRTQIACMSDSQVENQIQFFNKFENEVPLLHRYRADTAIRGFRGDMTSATFRFIFEARGIDTSEWQMIQRPEHYESFNIYDAGLLDHLANLLPHTSALKLWIINSRQMSGESKSQHCEQLKKLSMQSLSISPSRLPNGALTRAVKKSAHPKKKRAAHTVEKK